MQQEMDQDSKLTNYQDLVLIKAITQQSLKQDPRQLLVFHQEIKELFMTVRQSLIQDQELINSLKLLGKREGMSILVKEDLTLIHRLVLTHPAPVLMTIQRTMQYLKILLLPELAHHKDWVFLKDQKTFQAHNHIILMLPCFIMRTLLELFLGQVKENHS